jgi:hypothetical protein
MLIGAMTGCGADSKSSGPQTAAIEAVSPDTARRDSSDLPIGVHPGGPTQVEMRNVDFYVDPEVVLHIHRLRGTIRSRSGGPVVFDDKRSLIIHLAHAEVGLTGKDLTALLNKYVFAYPDAPLSDLRVATAGSQVVLTGHLHKGVSLPFTIRAEVSATTDGHIRMHPVQTKIVGLGVSRLMHGLGLSLQKLIDLRKARGASAIGNDIYLAPDSILPPPAIEGHVTAVRVEGDEVIETFDNEAKPARLDIPDSHQANFMFYRGGILRFGKLTMTDAEMQIVDLDPKDPFRFSLDRYNEQLVAGYSRTLPDLGLEVFMRDVDKLKSSRREIGGPSLRPVSR